MNNTKLWWGTAAGAAIIAVAAFTLFSGDDDAGEVPVGQVQRTVSVTRGDLDLTVSANGVVQPINKIELRSKAGGVITELNFIEGQAVTKGQLLIAVDRTITMNDYEQARADLELAQASVSQQENALGRARELHTKGLLSQQELDQVSVDHVRAKSQLVKARASLSSAEDRLEDTRIKAPIDGTILSKSVEQGQIIASATSNVGGGTLLATLADMSEVYVEANVDEVDIGNVRVGQRATVVADAYPDDRLRGEVVRIAPQGKTQQNVTTFSVLVLVRNVSGRLKAGMSTTVDIEIFRRQGVLLVALEALKDPRSEEGSRLLAALPQGDPGAGGRNDSAKTAAAAVPGAPDFAALREKLKDAPPEERRRAMQEARAQWEKSLESLPPAEREKAMAEQRARMQQFRARGGGPGGEGGGMPSGPAGNGEVRVRRTPQATAVTEVKSRVVEVKAGEEYVPRMVRVGASNFDFAEVVEGLNEGDEVRYTTLSRAKIASERMNERLRSSQGIGGMSTGAGGRRTP